ncbi:MAG: hypothetical protein R3E95_10910 [Thiolinea sp.]
MRHSLSGSVYGLVAYVIWGFFPLYFHYLAVIPAPEVLAQRIVWSFVFVAVPSWYWDGRRSTQGAGLCSHPARPAAVGCAGDHQLADLYLGRWRSSGDGVQFRLFSDWSACCWRACSCRNT